MEEAIICHSKTQRIEGKGDAAPQFTIWTLENKLSKKYAIIDYLSKQLVLSIGKEFNINNTSANIEVVWSNDGNVPKHLTMSRGIKVKNN